MNWWMAAALWACIVLVGTSLVGWMADAGLRDVIAWVRGRTKWPTFPRMVELQRELEHCAESSVRDGARIFDMGVASDDTRNAVRVLAEVVGVPRLPREPVAAWVSRIQAEVVRQKEGQP